MEARYPVALCASLLWASAFLPRLQAQVIADVFDGVGNETYPGVNGFGGFNWVNALNFGFSSQQGSNAFLSNYTGPPLANIGMIKPFSAVMANTTYRVAFYCSRYSSINTLSLASYDTLYIGSRHGTMVWDTFPTPLADYDWVRWSGLYTPAPQDIGQPFKFGFSLTLYTQTSFALDGPVTAMDVNTGITERLDAPSGLLAAFDPNGSCVRVQCDGPMTELDLYDASGALLRRERVPHRPSALIDTGALPGGMYVLRAWLVDGSVRTTRLAHP